MKHTHPNNSKYHLRLREFARKHGHSEDVRNLCWLTNAGLDLHAFLDICQNLSIILSLLQEHAGVDLAEYHIHRWPILLQWITKHTTKISSLLPSGTGTKVKVKRDGTSRVRGVSYHGCYSLLFHSHSNNKYRDKYFLLVGHVLLAHIKIMHQNTSRMEYEKYSTKNEQKEIIHKIAGTYPVELALRRLATQELEILLDKIDPYVKPDTFVDMFVRPAMQGRGEYTKELSDIINFIAIAHHLRRKQQRSRSKGYSRKTSSTRVQGNLSNPVRDQIPSDIGDAQDPYDDWGQQTLIWERTYEKKPTLQTLALDVCPDELAGEGEAYWSEYECETTRKGPGMLVTAAKGQIRQISMANQLFPWTYQILATSEITSLLTISSDLFRALQKKKVWDEEDSGLAEIISLIHILLWTGSSISRAKQFRILATNEESVDCDVALVLPAKPTQESPVSEWRIKSLAPAYKQKIEAPTEIIRKRQEYLLMPDVVASSEFVLYFARRMSFGKNEAIFKRKEKTYHKELNQFFTSLWANERFTVGKLSNHLFHSLVIHTNDITAAIAICGNPHRLAQARMFYSTIDINSLRNIYATVTRIIAENVYKASERQSISQAPKDYGQYPDLYVGSRLCAKFGAVHYAFVALREELRSITCSDRQQVQRYHNLFTLYTILGISYATAFRAVTSPYLSSSDIDMESGLTVIADKDGPEHHKSRLAWLPPDVIKQIGNYEAHRQSIEFMSNIDSLRSSTTLPPCYFLVIKKSGKYGYAQISPKTITPLLKEFLPLPPNAHRRFMRMQLLEKGCPPEVVDAYMGHWSRGEEPWGKFSSFSFFDYVQCLQKYLVPLLNDLNFCPIRSSLAKQT